MPRLVLTLVLLAGPALAEEAPITLVFGPDSLSAQSGDIQSVRRIDEEGLGSALVIRLAPSFDEPMRRLTNAHVGDTGALKICGQTVVEPHLHAPINEASFVISDRDPARIDRLQALLATVDCGLIPSS